MRRRGGGDEEGIKRRNSGDIQNPWRWRVSQILGIKSGTALI
jgi:hypothetical protein